MILQFFFVKANFLPFFGLFIIEMSKNTCLLLCSWHMFACLCKVFLLLLYRCSHFTWIQWPYCDHVTSVVICFYLSVFYHTNKYVICQCGRYFLHLWCISLIFIIIRIHLGLPFKTFSFTPEVSSEQYPFLCVDHYIKLHLLLYYSDTNICDVSIQSRYMFHPLCHT